MTERNRQKGDMTRGAKARRLAEIVREVKVAAAERDDVVVDMRDADRARLELLAQELQPVIDDVPTDNDQFDFALSSGLEPRFWIDAVAHVRMGRDRRTYRFLRDTRLGRTVLAETADKGEAAEAVTRYVAERLVERQRLLEGDYDSFRAKSGETSEASAAPREPGIPRQPAASDGSGRSEPAPATPSGAGRSRTVLIGLIFFFCGTILGGLAMMAAFADRLAN